MATTKRIATPCPWCGTRCCKIDGSRYKWACGSKDTPDGTRWQSPTCRNREIDQSAPSKLASDPQAEVASLKDAQALSGLEMQRQVDRVFRLQTEVEDLHRIAALERKAVQRGIDSWRAATGSEGLPDVADFTVWILNQLDSLQAIVGPIDELRDEEAASVQVACVNPDPCDEEFSQVIVCFGAWTGYVRAEFVGRDLVDCLQKAVLAKRAAAKAAGGE